MTDIKWINQEIKRLYPNITAFCADAKISQAQIYAVLGGKRKLTPIMERRILLALKAREWL